MLKGIKKISADKSLKLEKIIYQNVMWNFFTYFWFGPTSMSTCGFWSISYVSRTNPPSTTRLHKPLQKLTHGQLLDIYTVFIHSNIQVYLPVNTSVKSGRRHRTNKLAQLSMDCMPSCLGPARKGSCSCESEEKKGC